MNIILFDTETRKNLFPLTLTRAIADLRMGVFTIKERWAKLSGLKVFVLSETYLQALYEIPPGGEYFFIDAGVIPDIDLAEKILSLEPKQAIKDKDGFLAGRTFFHQNSSFYEISSLFKKADLIDQVQRILSPIHLFRFNKQMLGFDFELLSKNRISGSVNKTVHLSSPENIFIDDSASIRHSILNAVDGPIYIGKNATVMEGCLIRGPFALCEGAVLKMGTRIYGATTIGPFSTAGGEIKNSIITGYSNKGHDGYLGDSVIGEWCNLGAGTSNSNVKNTGSVVNLYDYQTKTYHEAGSKCGMIMGDYSRTAINSSINTGSVIGVSCNVFGTSLLPKFIPDFSWGANTCDLYRFDKALSDIEAWKKMKNNTLSQQERDILKHIFDQYTSN